MLEKFCVGLVRILLGGILFFLTLLSAVVTCRVYGGSEIVQYGRDSLFLHLFFGAGVIGTDGVLQAEKGTKVPEEPVASFSGCCLSFLDSPCPVLGRF